MNKFYVQRKRHRAKRVLKALRKLTQPPGAPEVRVDTLTLQGSNGATVPPQAIVCFVSFTV